MPDSLRHFIYNFVTFAARNPHVLKCTLRLLAAQFRVVNEMTVRIMFTHFTLKTLRGFRG